MTGFIISKDSTVLLCLVLLVAIVWGKEDTVNVGGWGDWVYEYEPSFLPLPPEANVEHAHGIAMTTEGDILVTYQDQTDPSKCLLRWKKSGYDKLPSFLGPGESLCKGVPHGLRAAVEDDTMYLYHANNEQSLHKTTVEGDIVWAAQGKPDPSMKGAFKPTWFASQPSSPYVYLADGYGASKVWVYDRVNGTYTGHSFGGHGTSHGKFMTDHAITFDWRSNQMAVCDRENHRLEYFTIDPKDPSVFQYTHTVSFYPLLQRPCNIRVRHEDGISIIPFLEGSVGILSDQNELMSVVNITDRMGDQGWLHPHDAHFLPGDSGDFILATWNPGRIGYFRRVSAGEAATPK